MLRTNESVIEENDCVTADGRNMLCRSCHHDIAESDDFCMQCGAQVSRLRAQENSTANSATKQASDVLSFSLKSAQMQIVDVDQVSMGFVSPPYLAKTNSTEHESLSPSYSSDRRQETYEISPHKQGKELKSHFGISLGSTTADTVTNTGLEELDLADVTLGSINSQEKEIVGHVATADVHKSHENYVRENSLDVASLERLWIPDDFSQVCMDCRTPFGFPKPRRHHCRVCGLLFCRSCLANKVAIPKSFGYGDTYQRCCRTCVYTLKTGNITTPADVFAHRRVTIESSLRESQLESSRKILQIGNDATSDDVRKQYEKLLVDQTDQVMISELHEAFGNFESCKAQKVSTITANVQGSFIDSELSRVASLNPTDMVRSDQTECQVCFRPFKFGRRQHHCRRCTRSVCNTCSEKSKPIPQLGFPQPVRHCISCLTNPPKFVQPNIQARLEPPAGLNCLSCLDIRISVKSMSNRSGATTLVHISGSDRSANEVYQVKLYCEPSEVYAKKLGLTISEADQTVANEYNFVQERSISDFEWLVASLGYGTNVKALPFFADRKILRNEQDAGSAICQGFLYGCLLHPIFRDADCFKAFLVLQTEDFANYRLAWRFPPTDNEMNEDVITAMRLELERAQMRRKTNELKHRWTAHEQRMADQKIRLQEQTVREESQLFRREQAAARLCALESRRIAQIERMTREKDRRDQQNETIHILYFDIINDKAQRTLDENLREKQKVEFRQSKVSFQNDTKEWNRNMTLWGNYRAKWSDDHNPAILKDIANEWIVQSYGVYSSRSSDDLSSIPREMLEMHHQIQELQETEPSILEEEGVALDKEWVKLAKERDHWATDRSNMIREVEMFKDEDEQFQLEHSIVAQEHEARQRKQAIIAEDIKVLLQQIMCRSKSISQRRQRHEDLDQEFEKEWRAIQIIRMQHQAARLQAHKDRISRIEARCEMYEDQLHRQMQSRRVLLFKRDQSYEECQNDKNNLDDDNEESKIAQAACHNVKIVIPEYIRRLEADALYRTEDLKMAMDSNKRVPQEGDDSSIDERDEFMNEIREKREEYKKLLEIQCADLMKEEILCSSLLSRIRVYADNLESELKDGDEENICIETFQTLMTQESQLLCEEKLKRQAKKNMLHSLVSTSGTWVMEALNDLSNRRKAEAERLVNQAKRAAIFERLVQYSSLRVIDQEERIMRQRYRAIRCEHRVQMLKTSSVWYEHVSGVTDYQCKKDMKILENGQLERMQDLRDAADLHKEDVADVQSVIKAAKVSSICTQLMTEMRAAWVELEESYSCSKPQDEDEDILMSAQIRDLICQLDGAYKMLCGRLEEESESLQRAKCQLEGEIASLKTFVERIESEESSLCSMEKSSLSNENNVTLAEKELIDQRARLIISEYKALLVVHQNCFTSTDKIKAARAERGDYIASHTAEFEFAEKLFKSRNHYDARMCAEFARKFKIDVEMKESRHVFEWLMQLLETDIRKADGWLDNSRLDRKQLENCRTQILQFDQCNDKLSKIPALIQVQKRLAENKSDTNSTSKEEVPIEILDSSIEKWVLELIELKRRICEVDQRLLEEISSTVNLANDKEILANEVYTEMKSSKEKTLDWLRHIDREEARATRIGEQSYSALLIDAESRIIDRNAHLGPSSNGKKTMRVAHVQKLAQVSDNQDTSPYSNTRKKPTSQSSSSRSFESAEPSQTLCFAKPASASEAI